MLQACFRVRAHSIELVFSSFSHLTKAGIVLGHGFSFSYSYEKESRREEGGRPEELVGVSFGETGRDEEQMEGRDRGEG